MVEDGFTKQWHNWTRTWRVGHGFQWCYNDCIKTKERATKCSDHRTICLTAHATKTAAMIRRKRTERKIDEHGDQFAFRRGKETRDAIRMLSIIWERTLKKWIVCLLRRLAEGIWPCKMYQINTDPKGNWCEMYMYMDQRVRGTITGSEGMCEDWNRSWVGQRRCM